MKATQVLMIDHEETTTMLNTLVAGDMKPTDPALFGRLKEALKLHASVEEKIFYRALESFEETSEFVKEASREHKKVEELLGKMTPGDSSWDDQLMELRRKVIHHAEEEEKELFPKAEELLGEEKLVQLGREIQALKTETSGRTVAAPRLT